MQRQRKWSSAGIAGWTLAIPVLASTAAAQVTLQQPAVSQFSVGTTVSVPVGGGALLGGLHRAGAGRKSFGPLRPGTATGFYREAQSVTAHVTLHDFETMDRLLLDQARGTATAQRTRLNGPAANAYRQLAGTRTGRRGSTVSHKQSHRLAQPAASGGPQGPVATARSDRGARAYRLGQDALRRGRPTLARLHFQMAARYGSAEALHRLAELDRSIGRTAAAKQPR